METKKEIHIRRIDVEKAIIAVQQVIGSLQTDKSFNCLSDHGRGGIE